MLRIENIDWSIGSATILSQISLEIKVGELVIILGPNGAGKSSLLQLMAGSQSPQTGSIHLKGKPLSSWSAKALARERAVLPQQTHIPFDLSVLDTVCLGRYAQEELPAQSRAIAKEQLRQVGMLDYAERSIRQLSGGQQQRVHFARCLAQLYQAKPVSKLLLLDEPTASLDLQYQHEVLQQAQQLAREERYAVVAILHDINLAAQYADRLLFLRAGRSLGLGAVAEMLCPQKIQACFGVEAIVQPHPVLNCPSVLTYGKQAAFIDSSIPHSK